MTREHLLAECLLVDVIGLEWEHVMSEAVERRIRELLRHPTESPYGNPIPGLAELGDGSTTHPFPGDDTIRLSDLEPGSTGAAATVRRIGESIQIDPRLMHTLRRAGVRPGAVVRVRSSSGGVLVGGDAEVTELPTRTATHIFVVRG